VEAIAPAVSLGCTGSDVLSGTNGFWACVDSAGNSVKLRLNGLIIDTSNRSYPYTVESQFSPRNF
ncbi:MAG: hypothetical protein AAGB01_09570, partial [Cyanobacteria bacterium P01_F01_bin.42]